MPPLTGTVKQNKGIEGTVLRQDNLISSASPGVASTMTKLNSSPSRKAFSVQDKVYAFLVRPQLILLYDSEVIQKYSCNCMLSHFTPPKL
jgi:hypothetical protein